MDALTSTATATRTSQINPVLSGWLLLAALQAGVCVALFHDYLAGDKYFAFVDIGSDTYEQFVPMLIYLASPAHWSSAWSFNVGLGGVIGPPVSPFTLLGIAGGPDHVLAMRIWVYLAKIVAGGGAFYAFTLALGAHRAVALIAGLSYSFCGYVMTDGQWDPSSAEFAGYAFLLWAIARRRAHPNSWLIPVTVALAVYGGAFIYSLGVFTLYVFAAALVASDDWQVTARSWIKTVFPQCLLGVLLAAPVLVPQAFVLLDSPRVTGPQSGFSNRFAEILSVNDWTTVLLELAAFFHKNIMGVGDVHTGWMNYLENPGFFSGVLVLLIIPQLQRGSGLDRKILLAGTAALAAFVLFPAIRYLAFGFGLDYFRVNNLWVTILLLAMFTKALGVVATRGIDRRLLVATGAVLAIGIVALQAALRPYLSVAHAVLIATFLGAGILLCTAFSTVNSWRKLAYAALAFVAAEAAIVNYPSFHGPRKPVTAQTPGFGDSTMDALAFIKARDAGFYRIEKTYNSVSLCDALAQGYMGVKSYWFQGAGAVGFFSALELLPSSSPIKNFTNWLPTFGNRFALDSLVGIKYMLTKTPLDWPGFNKIGETAGVSIFENELALPLGVVYEKQFPRESLAILSSQAKDITLINAAIVEKIRGDRPRTYDPIQLKRQSPDWLTENYVNPARVLQRRGMKVEDFSNGHITGSLTTEVPGILVFSIPYAKGWSLAIDGHEQPLFRANLGMLAADIGAGTHRLELRYSLPGLLIGFLAALIGVTGIGVMTLTARRSQPFRLKQA